MVDETKEPMEKEEKPEELTWEEYVKLEISALLNTYLPYSVNGNVGIKYIHPIKAQYEGSTEFDDDKYSGVEIRVVFQFEEDLVIRPDNKIEENTEG